MQQYMCWECLALVVTYMSHVLAVQQGLLHSLYLCIHSTVYLYRSLLLCAFNTASSPLVKVSLVAWCRCDMSVLIPDMCLTGALFVSGPSMQLYATLCSST